MRAVTRPQPPEPMPARTSQRARPTVSTSITGGVATVTLQRGERANAIDLELARHLSVAVQTVGVAPGVRAILLLGEGEWFCAGGDLKSFAAEGEHLPSHLRAVTMHLHIAIARLVRSPLPIVVGVQGIAAGAGFSLAMAADVVVAEDATKFVPAYAGVGLTPDGSLTNRLPRLVGLRRAVDIVLNNRPVSAQEGLEWGLVSRVVPVGAAQPIATSIAHDLASGPTASLGAAKELLNGSLDSDLEVQMEREARALSIAASSVDGREGIAAFLDKRAPVFIGR